MPLHNGGYETKLQKVSNRRREVWNEPDSEVLLAHRQALDVDHGIIFVSRYDAKMVR